LREVWDGWAMAAIRGEAALDGAQDVRLVASSPLLTASSSLSESSENDSEAPGTPVSLGHVEGGSKPPTPPDMMDDADPDIELALKDEEGLVGGRKTLPPARRWAL
jgi:hypothetical protein